MHATMPAHVAELDVDPALRPAIEQALAGHGMATPIPDGLKAAYRARQLDARRPHNRTTAIALTVIFDLFWFVELRSAPELVWLSGILHLAVTTPLALLFVLLDWRGRLDRLYDAALVTVSVTVGMVAAVLCVRTTSLTTLSDIRSTPLILLATGLIMRLSPPAVIVNAVISVSVFSASVWLSAVVPRAELGSLILNDVAIGVVTWGFSHMLEQRDRSIFLLRALDALRRAELASQNVGLRTEAETDALTGVASRRYFDQTLAATWREALRSGDWVGLIMIDIDHFKKFNDRYGHQSGDDCLRRVATQAAWHVRENDLFARYGGEEFVVVLPAASIVTVTEVAERLRASIEDLALPHAGRTEGGIVTISLGVASVVPTHRDGVRQLIELADQDLYEAKRCGRNRVGTNIDRVLGLEPGEWLIR